MNAVRTATEMFFTHASWDNLLTPQEAAAMCPADPETFSLPLQNPDGTDTGDRLTMPASLPLVELRTPPDEPEPVVVAKAA